MAGRRRERDTRLRKCLPNCAKRAKINVFCQAWTQVVRFMHLLPIITVCTAFSEGTYMHLVNKSRAEQQEQRHCGASISSFLHIREVFNHKAERRSCGPPVAMMRPGADSLDRIGILRSWIFSSWLHRWAKCREQPLSNWEMERGGRERNSEHGNAKDKEHKQLTASITKKFYFLLQLKNLLL